MPGGILMNLFNNAFNAGMNFGDHWLRSRTLQRHMLYELYAEAIGQSIERIVKDSARRTLMSATDVLVANFATKASVCECLFGCTHSSNL
jgi:hypothetical protein